MLRCNNTIARAFALVLLLLTAPVAVLGAEGFFEGVDELPLMPGLVQAEQGALVFESPGGRIVEVYAVGEAEPARILDFYGETLPQLGWAARDRNTYAREGEVLSLDFPDGPGPATTLRITLTPTDAPSP